MGTQPVGRFETNSWLFMRISGIVLLVMAVLHLLLMHYAVGVENLTFDVVAQRWAGPWWRLFDFFLLALAWTHGANGARIVISDYIRPRGWRLFANTLLALVYTLLLVVGAYVIVTFNVTA
jgi:succinate dehydrogenase / fumarate reductase membrane anchor subunit